MRLVKKVDAGRDCTSAPVCLHTEEGYDASIFLKSLSRSSGSAPVCCKIFASVNDSSCTVRCSVSDSLVSVTRKGGQHLRNAQRSNKIDNSSVDRLVKPGNYDSTGGQEKTY